MTAVGVLDQLERCRVLPVVVIDDPGKAGDLADALVAGSIWCAEITLRTPQAVDSIAQLAARTDFLVGAGTVRSVSDVECCADAGARFIVSPGFDRKVVERAHELDLVVFPGIATATELGWALAAGSTVVKFFPAKQLGGLDAIRSLTGPFPEARFIPSGGVTLANATEYLRNPNVFAVSGSWMAPPDALSRGDFTAIRHAVSQTTIALRGIR